MTCYDSAHFEEPMDDCWSPNTLDAVLNAGHMKGLGYEVKEVVAHISKMFDEAMAQPKGKFHGFNVTWKSPGEDWRGTPLQVLYDIVEDERDAALAYGNLVCRVACNRAEHWWCYPEETHADGTTSRSYVLWEH